MAANVTSSLPAAVPPTRRRARKACLACRQRKRKCDVKLPCSMCTTYGYRCQYPKDEGPAAAFVQHESPPKSSNSVDEAPGSIAGVMDGGIHSMATAVEARSKIPSTAADPGILDPFKSRYMSQHSAVAFPRSLGLDLQSATPLRLHSFAWNCGVRPEETAVSHIELSDLISREDFVRCSDVYFSIVHPIFGVLDRQNFLVRCDGYWSSANREAVFGSVISGVVALGSLFSFPLGHPRESEIVHHAKSVLEDPTFSRLPSIEQVTAWILRTQYLRATTRPHNSWLASCITLHLAEATGLHHEVNEILLATDNTAQSIESDPNGSERARRLFWCAWSQNMLISYEYGRSHVVLSSISCKLSKSREGEFLSQIIRVARLLPSDNSNLGLMVRKEELERAVDQLHQIPDEHPFLSLTKADICFCFYRRLRLLRLGIEKGVVLDIISIGNRAVEAADRLAQESRPWWNVLGSVFQYVCVLLAIDSSESLSNVSWAIHNLEKIVQNLGTGLAVEALNTAKLLVRDSIHKKRRELAFLEVADDANLTASERDVEIDWDAFLDPSYNNVLTAQDFSLY